MTSIPASRKARAITFAPRSCPSRPGLATSTRILDSIFSLETEVLPIRRSGLLGRAVHLALVYTGLAAGGGHAAKAGILRSKRRLCRGSSGRRRGRAPAEGGG